MRLLAIVLLLSSLGFAQGTGGGSGIGGKAGFGGGLLCSNTSYGLFTCVSNTSGFTSGSTTRAQTISVTSGDAVLLIGQALSTGSTLTLSDSGACTGAINTASSPNGLALASSVVIAGLTTATSTGTCTITMTWAGAATTITSAVWHWSGWSGTTDQTGALASVTGTTNLNCPAVTTSVNGDLVLCMMQEMGNNGNPYSAVAPFSILGGGQSANQEGNVQGSSGAITPQFSYGSSGTFGVVTFALEH